MANNTSPTLNTLAHGTPWGRANTSPKNHSLVWGPIAVELLCTIPACSMRVQRPAARRASSEAGMRPPLARMAAALHANPRATSQIPRRCRLAHKKAPRTA